MSDPSTRTILEHYMRLLDGHHEVYRLLTALLVQAGGSLTLSREAVELAGRDNLLRVNTRTGEDGAIAVLLCWSNEAEARLL